MRGLKRHRSVRAVTAGHAFVQNLRRGHYDIATEHPHPNKLAAAFSELALCL
jgi:IS6 family transposase